MRNYKSDEDAVSVVDDVTEILQSALEGFQALQAKLSKRHE